MREPAELFIIPWIFSEEISRQIRTQNQPMVDILKRPEHVSIVSGYQLSLSNGERYYAEKVTFVFNRDQHPECQIFGWKM